MTGLDPLCYCRKAFAPIDERTCDDGVVGVSLGGAIFNELPGPLEMLVVPVEADAPLCEVAAEAVERQQDITLQLGGIVAVVSPTAQTCRQVVDGAAPSGECFCQLAEAVNGQPTIDLEFMIKRCCCGGHHRTFCKVRRVTVVEDDLNA